MPLRCVGRVLIPLSVASEPFAEEITEFVMHGQCDARPTVTFPAAGYHRPLAGTKLYFLVNRGTYVCEQLTQGCHLAVLWAQVDLRTFRLPV